MIIIAIKCEIRHNYPQSGPNTATMGQEHLPSILTLPSSDVDDRSNPETLIIKTAPLDQNLKQIGEKHLKQTPHHQGYALPLTSVIPITPHTALNSHSIALTYNLSNLQFSHYQASPMEQPQGSALHTFITNPPKETASWLCSLFIPLLITPHCL